MAAEQHDRFSTTARLKALGEQAAAHVYRAQNRRLRRPRTRLTGRAALLVLVVGGLVVALAYPVRQYVAQRADIAEQRREVAEARERVERLRDQEARWQDPAYVEQQAREHLQYVRPGETGLVFPGSGDADEEAEETQEARETREARREEREAAEERPWFEELWNGVDPSSGASGVPGASGGGQGR
ncbi:FtsB family cell division protein [Streptomyces sp. 4N509B]|uniref:FtsB family cell division protein n=1 Tax=Streptomyces sp. 4N509B TaxID=3457413 RepID=UPI003FD28365